MPTLKNAETKAIEANGISFVYRELGPRHGVPVIFLHHLTAILDDWDPALLDAIAAKYHVAIFDNRGVGGTGGTAPTSVQEMAEDAIALIHALGFDKVSLFGFSLGGFVAQAIMHARPGLVRMAVLAGTGPAGGKGISNVGAVLQDAVSTTTETARHPKEILFFTQTRDGQKAAGEFLQRLNHRVDDRDAPISDEAVRAQLTAIRAWGDGPSTPLESIDQPVLVANGDHDVMVPSMGSVELARRIPHANLSIFPNSGHGAIFEYHATFVPQVLSFLDTSFE